MKKLNKQQIVLLHGILIKQTGGALGIRDEGLWEATINAPFSTFEGQHLYPTVEAKAAKLAWLGQPIWLHIRIYKLTVTEAAKEPLLRNATPCPG